MSKPTHLIAIDLGEVLLNVDHMHTYHRLSARCALTPEDIAARLDDHALIHALDRGTLSADEFAAALGAELGTAIGTAELRECWSGILSVKHDVCAWLAAMLPRATCVLVSNTNAWHWEEACALLPLLDRLDGQVLSFREGTRKPEPKYYRRVRERYPMPHALFIDDRGENCAGAAAHGFRTCQFRELAALAPLAEQWLAASHR